MAGAGSKPRRDITPMPDADPDFGPAASEARCATLPQLQ